ncbi:MAG: hypothetical protein COB03_03195 [Alteromonas sp.]|nr:MAG: hypothetical protein COB03_03195 [Alteromonas sp.]
MITPTRTVCYAIPVGSDEKFIVNSARVNGVLVERQQRPIKLHYLCYSEVDQLIVREEPVKHYHPGMIHEIDSPVLKIGPGEVKHYPATECAKKFFLNADCLCEGCAPNLWPRHHSAVWSSLARGRNREK